MATILLSAVGAAAGASIGGGVLGLSSVAIGRAIGATAGQVLDRAWLAPTQSGSAPVETGRVDRFRLTGASEGTPVPEIYGRVRVGGQVIWASRFVEHVSTRQVATGGSGKGGGGRTSTEVRDYSYTVSLAMALCAGEIARVGRVWADGRELDPSEITLRVYPGSETQLPDPKIEAVEGAGRAPAFRGIAYVVVEDLELAPFGNRVPQFSFEVVRGAQPDVPAAPETPELSRLLRAVALTPGTGEYALATTPVRYETAPGVSRSANVHAPGGRSDLDASLDVLRADLPGLRAASLVVSWFGDDLRCGACAVRPKVEQAEIDGAEMPWRVSGLARSEAGLVPAIDGRPVYGGTPADQAVTEAIAALRAGGQAVMFYPFVLMEQLAGNGRTDPWTGAADQPALPWRGRITLSSAPGRAGSPDGTAAAEAEVAAFFGTAAPGDFSPGGGTVHYHGPTEFSFRRFILHYAHLCAAAGGVEAFCIGSELRGLTRIRGAGGTFPAVDALRALAADVRAVLGQDTKIGYAADWSEYFGYQPQDGSGDVYFNLDPLWADEAVDFIGIDSYMPLSDWRAGEEHADAERGSVLDLGYLRDNVEGGEGYDWYYEAPESAEAQRRTPITDGAHGEPWVFRFKDLRAWWSQPHHERIGGVRQAAPTAWVPRSKPIWLTEIGCPAVDLGANQPNLFWDPKSSESALPRGSSGRRDDAMQMQYLRAALGYWSEEGRNPQSDLYGGPMIDLERCFAWAWDTRPYPFFPGNLEVWSDGENYRRGHWLNGRISSRPLDAVVAEICARAGLGEVDVSGLHGVVRGYAVEGGATARAALQPLMQAYGFEAIERGGRLVFRMRTGRVSHRPDPVRFAVSREVPGDLERLREAAAETAGRLRLNAVEADGDYEVRANEAVLADEATRRVTRAELSLVLTAEERREIAERWLAEARTARDTVRFALPPSGHAVAAGDVIELGEAPGPARYRVERVEAAGLRLLEAVRIEADHAHPVETAAPPAAATGPAAFVPQMPLVAEFLDLPLLTGTEAPEAPHLAVFAEPWRGPAAVYAAAGADGFVLNSTHPVPAVMGETLTPLVAAAPDLWDRGAALRVRLSGGALSSCSEAELLNGANAAAIGTSGTDDWEVIQFRDAVLVAPGTYELAMRLRGQLGTDAAMPPVWPAGSRFVLLDGAPRQIALQPAQRGLVRSYRVGPAAAPADHPVHLPFSRAFAGVGLRPYAPVHLSARPDGAGGFRVAWVRRTRIDGDSWSGLDVPLGEDRELYLLRVMRGGDVLREQELGAPEWHYAAAEVAADAGGGAIAIAVAQVSARFGPGLFRSIEINA